MLEVFHMRSARETFIFDATCFCFSGALDMQRISVHKDSISVTDHTAQDRKITASFTTAMQAKCLVMEDTELQYHKYNTFTVLYVFIVVWTYQVTIVFMFGIGCINIWNFFLKNISNTNTHLHIYWEWHIFLGRFHSFIFNTRNHQILDTFKSPGICKSVHHETNLTLHKCLYNYNDFLHVSAFQLGG